MIENKSQYQRRKVIISVLIGLIIVIAVGLIFRVYQKKNYPANEPYNSFDTIPKDIDTIHMSLP